MVGKKMSKSFGNAIGLDESPEQMFGKVMSVSDELMERFYELLTDHDLDAVARMHPKEAKLRLGELLVDRFHGLPAARDARSAFERRHGGGEFVTAEDIRLSRPEGAPAAASLIDVLHQAGLVSSKSEGRRLIRQGAVEVDGDKRLDPAQPLQAGRVYEIRVGKKRFCRVHT